LPKPGVYRDISDWSVENLEKDAAGKKDADVIDLVAEDIEDTKQRDGGESICSEDEESSSQEDIDLDDFIKQVAALKDDEQEDAAIEDHSFEFSTEDAGEDDGPGATRSEKRKRHKMRRLGSQRGPTRRRVRKGRELASDLNEKEDSLVPGPASEDDAEMGFVAVD
jgi:hypothetical protein